MTESCGRLVLLYAENLPVANSGLPRLTWVNTVCRFVKSPFHGAWLISLHFAVLSVVTRL